MDLSALIFVALAVAWAAYLIPKALRHHEIDRATRSVESFSDRVRVVARREPEPEPAPVAKPPSKSASKRIPEPARTSPSPARRRRRVLALVLLANVVVVALAAADRLAWAWVAIPATLLVAWLVACRLMVRRERAVRAVRKRRTTLAEQVLAEEDADSTDGADGDETGTVAAADDDTDQIPAVAQAPSSESDPDAWEPVPVTLPTYVAKAAAGRSVRTIDLDSTGVWSSGRNASDSALAREADEHRSEPVEAEQRRASGA